MRPDVTGIEITLDGAAVASETTIATVSAYVVVLSSVLPTLAVTLISTYLGQIDDPTTAVSHLRLVPEPGFVPGTYPALEQRLLHAHHHPTHLRGCLLEHLAELRELLANLTRGVVAIDTAPDALDLQWGP